MFSAEKKGVFENSPASKLVELEDWVHLEIYWNRNSEFNPKVGRNLKKAA